MASRHCDVCNFWHDLEQPWPEACMDHYRRKRHKEQDAHYVMGDIQPYQATFTDGTGKRVEIKSRGHHRDELRARGYQEVGNEKAYMDRREEKAPPPIEKTISEAFRAYEQGYRPRPMTRQEFNS